ncbi:hypothetical protein SAM23877_7440 [Streptomyces ambofaciens ATCC 23877]|uniref:Uncharacterized protein n=1 Tax=Streptomyces ambofaciens (strain ATCC 23877 / 3486 / DSM 40053 / JCM 4204 / NBRC 12836 / NRRL B-2516) TaxID=278992 RepID=A0A0K2B5R6_STRA7|nr:hypothetical protein SAM23877_7440 [Streptomyces ambofaciens ATCC 23877]
MQTLRSAAHRVLASRIHEAFPEEHVHALVAIANEGFSERDEDTHRSPALHGHRRPADLQQHHPQTGTESYRLTPAIGPSRTSPDQLTGRHTGRAP